VRIIKYEAPTYAVFSIHLSLPPLYDQITFSAAYCLPASAYVPP